MANTDFHQRLTRIQKNAVSSAYKRAKDPGRREREEQFVAEHEADTDTELYEYVKDVKRKLGKQVKQKNIVGYRYICRRLGPWGSLMCRICKELSDERKAAGEEQAPIGHEEKALLRRQALHNC